MPVSGLNAAALSPGKRHPVFSRMPNPEYRPQIDSLRAVAVFAVMYSHFWDEASPWGHYGVRLFFVISGYLITGILIRSKEAVRSQGTLGVILVFYLRRALRIFPAYYVMLALAAAFLPEVRTSLPWHTAYLSNVLFALNGNWDPWPLAHLWSLSVEEQFYLFWPLLIVLSPGRTLIPTLIGIILAAVAFRAAIMFYLPEGPARYVLTPAAFDALGAGALLAAVEASNRLTDVLRWRLAIASVAAIAIVAISFTLQAAMFNFILGDFLTVVPLAAVVSWASVGAKGLIKRLAENSAVRYLGRISYGIYLYHFPALAVVFLFCGYFEMQFPPLGPIRFVIAGLVTVAAAAASWHLLEQPLNRLKARLSYTAAPAGN